MIQKGDKIHAIDEDRILIVEGLWGEVSKSVDFSATYTHSAGKTTDGKSVYGNRGFRFQDEGIIWNIITE